MTRTYGDMTAERRAGLDRVSIEHARAFEQTCRLALQIVELRERCGLTQTQLAEQCDVDQVDIRRIERGSNSTTIRVLLRIADALDADLRLVARTS